MSHAALYLVAVMELKKKIIDVKGKNGIICFTLEFLNILDFFKEKKAYTRISFLSKMICDSMFYILSRV